MIDFYAKVCDQCGQKIDQKTLVRHLAKQLKKQGAPHMAKLLLKFNGVSIHAPKKQHKQKPKHVR